MALTPHFKPLAPAAPAFLETPTPNNMPAPQTRRWFAWLGAYVDWWHTQCPLARTTTYYVAANGSDSSDGLSPSTPFQTLAKVNAVINASSGDVRVRLRRGDVWRVTPTGSAPNLDMRGVYINKDNVTLDSYTDEAATGTSRNRKPVVTPFVAVASASWSTDGTYTNSYKCTVAALTGAVNAVAWFRESLDTSEDRVFTRQTSAANVDAVPGSFYYDPAASLLWMRPHLNGPAPTSSWHTGYEYVPQWRLADMPTCLPAVYATNVTGTRVDGVRVDGWLPTWNDISAAAGAQAVRLDIDGTKVALLTGVEAYYSHQHILMKGDTGAAGGHLMCVGCRTSGGMAVEAANSRQVQDHLISYSALGGNTGIFVDCEGVMGRLPSTTYTDFAKQGEYIRCHTNGATEPALMVAYRCRVRPNFWMPSSFGTFGNMPAWTGSGDMAACRAFKARCEFPARPRDPRDDTWWANPTTDCVVYNTGWDGVDTVWMGCKVTTKAMRSCSGATPNAYQNGNTAAQTLVNCVWDVDLSLTKADVVSLGLGTAVCRWYYSHFRFRYAAHSGSSQPQLGLGKAYAGGNTWANAAQNLKAFGNVFEVVGAPTADDAVVSGLGNNLDSGGSVLAPGTEREKANVYVGGFTSSGTTGDYWGTCNVPGVVSAASATPRPALDSPLVAVAAPTVEGAALEHDLHGQARNGDHPTLGPVQAAPYTSQAVLA